MVRPGNPFQRLAARVKEGDEMAIRAFREQLLPHLERMVRRVVRSGATRSSFDGRVHKEVAEFQAEFGLSGKELNKQVARRLFASILRQVMSSKEPVSAGTDTQAIGLALETVCES